MPMCARTQCFANHPVAYQNIADRGLSEWRQVHYNLQCRFYSHGGVQHVESVLRAPNKVDVTHHGFRAVKTPCGDQLPSHRRHFGQLARCRNNLVFQTAMSAKTICKSSLAQLLATEFDFILTFARLQLLCRLHA